MGTYLSGCAFTTDYAMISYDPQPNAKRIEGADSVKVGVRLSDVRDVEGNTIGRKRNAFGIPMAPILADRDVVETIEEAIESELVNRGFNLSEESSVLAVELFKFYSDLRPGFWSATAVAELNMNVQLRSLDGDIVFAKTVHGGGENPGCQIYSGENLQVALNLALKDAISVLFNDASFIEELLKLGGKSVAMEEN
jgi:uncharacterized lipoprotein YajG